MLHFKIFFNGSDNPAKINQSDDKKIKRNKMKVYAVAGNPISHSKSPVMMNHVMKSLKMKALYTRLLASNVEDIALLAEDIPLAGLNITSPFKKDILQLARSTDLIVQSMGVANMLVRDKNGLFSAQNTDVKGVRDAVAHLFTEPTLPPDEFGEIPETAVKKVLILGSGGAAPAAIKALEPFHCEIFLSGRNIEKTRELAGKTGVKTEIFTQIPNNIGEFSLIINTIPVRIPLFGLFSFLPEQHILDAPYNNPPLREKCLAEGAEYIGGETWLIQQAIHGFKNFTGKWVEREKFAEAIQLATAGNEKGKQPSIALVGPMGAGKTTTGKILAEKLGYEWIDTDQRIESETGMSIEDIFRQKGESYFREIEKKLFSQLVLLSKTVISCGGGIVLDELNRKLLSNHFHTVFLYVKAGQSIKRMGKTTSRPLLTRSNPVQKAYELMQERLPHYLSTSSVIVNTHGGDVQNITELIYEDYRQTFHH